MSGFADALPAGNTLSKTPTYHKLNLDALLAKKESGRFEEAIADLQTASPLSFRVDDSQLAIIIDDLLREMRNNGGNPEDE